MLDMIGVKEIAEQFLTGAAIADSLDDLATLLKETMSG